MIEMRSVRLKSGDRDLARALFTTIAAVFDEDSEPLSDDHIDRLLAREDFWAIAAFAGDQIIGGLTAYTLALTRTESSELFIYDIAVRREEQRKGIGRQLLAQLREGANANGIHELFVAVDNGDVHALDFYRALGGTESPVTFFAFNYREH
jgi:aminoglycoside 3-N-acetyltransferase I